MITGSEYLRGAVLWSRAVELRWYEMGAGRDEREERGHQEGQGRADLASPHPAPADCQDVTKKVLTFADTNPRMKENRRFRN